MSNSAKKSLPSRRQFIGQVAVTAAAAELARAEGKPAGAAAQNDATLPTISIGPHRVTRLIAGWNPIGGYSYLGPNMDKHMLEYFTEDRTVEFLQRCSREGINTHQFDPTEMMFNALRRVRESGSSMQFLCLHSVGSRVGSVKEVGDASHPFAFSHHGGVTDRLFREGKSEQVHDYVKEVHDLGYLAGVSAHNPDNIRRMADAGWENDFFMTCFHYLTKLDDHPDLIPSVTTIGKAFYKADPERMTEVISQVDRPCLAFKILAAGRAGFSSKGVASAFEYAFERIKPTDAVIVGMYPRFRDEIKENCELTLLWGQPSADRLSQLTPQPLGRN